MRTLLSLIIFLPCCLGRGQSPMPLWAHERLEALKSDYSASNYLKSRFLEADFSGDGKPDLALAVEKINGGKKGIIILFQESTGAFVIGAGKEFGNAGDNFQWAGNWRAFTERVTYETTFKENGDVAGGKEVKLLRPAIEIREEEGSGGLIYFNGKDFVWIHQGD